MFLEVYAIPLSDYSEDTDASVRLENRRLIEMTGARIRHSTKFADQTEIVMPNKEILIVAGSYDALIARLENAQSGIARA